MRFLSKWGRLIVQIRPMQAYGLPSGLIQVQEEPIYAQFEPQGVTGREREMALARFSFEGQYQHQDEARLYPPDYRIGVYDTTQAQNANSWTDELRLFVEHQLREIATNFESLIEVPATFFAPPWPRYDDFKGAPSALLRKLVDEGHDLDAVLDYEQANQDRAPVVAALEEAIEAGGALREEEVVG